MLDADAARDTGVVALVIFVAGADGGVRQSQPKTSPIEDAERAAMRKVAFTGLRNRYWEGFGALGACGLRDLDDELTNFSGLFTREDGLDYDHRYARLPVGDGVELSVI